MKVVFDIDGTISFDGHHIDDQIVSQINQLPIDRHQLVFASARPIRDLLPIVGEFADTALIGGNGAIVSQGGDIRVIRPIPTENFELVKQLIARYGLDYVIDDKWNYAARVQQESPIRKQLDPGHLAQNVDLRTITQPIKMILLNLKERQLAEISQALRRRTTLAIVEHRGEHNIDLTAAGINKYTTFQILFPHEKLLLLGMTITIASCCSTRKEACGLAAKARQTKRIFKPIIDILPRLAGFCQRFMRLTSGWFLKTPNSYREFFLEKLKILEARSICGNRWCAIVYR